MKPYLIGLYESAWFFSTVIFFFLNSGCQPDSQRSQAPAYETDEFKAYWYAGKAEINTYRLSQSRYGENREGKAVLIFVTEDFSRKKQVKLDDPENAGRDKVSVLKMNFTKNFITGIYPYSMMQSVFTPVNRNEYPVTLKTTMSVQEWCGQVFTQMNFKGNRFRVKSYSYFEEEADEQFSISKGWLEDEIWNMIRLDPAALPEGQVEIVPALFFSRVHHTNLQRQVATATKTTADDHCVYTVTYPHLNRSITIEHDTLFPYKILGWKETFRERDTEQTTFATLDKTLVIDYWTKNKTMFEPLRDSLNLPR